MFSLEHYERAAVACAECGSLDEAIREMTLVDRSEAMLGQSRNLNPDLPHFLATCETFG